MLAELERPGELPSGAELALEPFGEPDFVVRSLGVSYDEDLDRIILVAEEIDRTEPEDEPESLFGLAEDLEPEVEAEEGSSVRVSITREQAAALAISRDRARRGRPAALPAVRVPARPERPRVPEDERPPPAPDLSGPAWLELLSKGELEVLGRLPWSSNYSFLATVRLGEIERARRLQARTGRAPALGLPGGTVPP